MQLIPGRVVAYRLWFLMVGLLFLLPLRSLAQLPELGGAATVSGQPSAARFYGGVQVNGSEEFVASVQAHDLMTLRMGIDVAPEDEGRSGNLYLVVEIGGTFLMGTPQGFPAWDLTLEGLEPLATGRQLADFELLTVLDNLPPAAVDVGAVNLALIAGYSLASAPDNIIYGPDPLVVSIEDYEPLPTADWVVETIDTLVVDQSRDREIPVLIYLPQSQVPRPVILFSHGLGGSRFAATYLGDHWARRGYVSVFMQHPGSDASILEGVPPLQILAVLNEAANAANSVARIVDVSVVLDQLAAWHTDPLSPLHGRLDLDHVGMSGHSFGARTTQSVSGQTGGLVSTLEPRIDAAVIFSPSTPGLGSPEAAFGSVELPWLLMTGTNDDSVIGDTSPEDRLDVYPALPPGGKYELVLWQGEHHAFTDGSLTVGQVPRNPAHHPMIQALSTAFWDAYLQGFAGARRWLEGDPARAILQPGDSWQFK